MCELQARVFGDKHRWSSSWRPICQLICHGWSFIVHKGASRLVAEKWKNVSHERMIIPDSGVSFSSNLITALLQQNTGVHVTACLSLSLLCCFNYCDLFLLEHLALKVQEIFQSQKLFNHLGFK